MVLFKVLLFSTAISLTVGLPIDEILGSAEIIQSLGRVISTNNLEKYGIDTKNLDPRIVADAFLTVPELIKKYGYPMEQHTVQTPDGYLLEMHRIPKPGAQPVFLLHGLLDSSAAWIIMGPHSSLGYYLADLGYDVWMGNVRGNRYSRNHIYLSPEHKDFWDYSFHEIGSLDVPAMLDYVIAHTGFEKIHYVGHSQGTTAFWVMCTQRPGYCDKIKTMSALAPIAFLENARSPLVRAIARFVDQAELLLKLMGMHEFLPSNDLLTLGGQLLCKEESLIQELCSNVLFLIVGYNADHLNKTMLPVIFGHIPAGSSSKQFIHYGQLINSGHFRMFDYGLIKNVAKYGKLKPPTYDLSKVTAPVTLYYSLNDLLADIKDVNRLRKKLPNSDSHLISLPKFNHLDFTCGIGSRQLVYEKVADEIDKFEKKNL